METYTRGYKLSVDDIKVAIKMFEAEINVVYFAPIIIICDG